MSDQNTKFFGIGLSRTGTLSLTQALSALGIEAVHYPNDARTQEELTKGCYALSLLQTVQAVTDIPVSPFYPQFDKAFPDSKFILTTRSTDTWLASVERHFRMYVEHQRDSFDDFVFACVYGCLHFDAERFRYVKDLHEANVLRYFSDKPHRLLILDVSQGDPWVPLCSFLGRPVPNEDFPHRNRALPGPVRTRKLTRRLAKLLPRGR